METFAAYKFRALIFCRSADTIFDSRQSK